MSYDMTPGMIIEPQGPAPLKLIQSCLTFGG